jgi:hypothetical protein
MQKALNVVVKWAAKEGMNISPHKTAIVPFTNRRILEILETCASLLEYQVY